EYVHGNLLDLDDLSVDDNKGKESEEIEAFMMDKVRKHYDKKEQELTDEKISELEKVRILRTVNTKWMDNIDRMKNVRQGNNLRTYGQDDTLSEYKLEGFEMFEAMVASIEEEVAKYIMKAQIRNNLQREAVAKNTQAVSGGEEKEQKKRKPYVRKVNVGRND